MRKTSFPAGSWVSDATAHFDKKEYRSTSAISRFHGSYTWTARNILDRRRSAGTGCFSKSLGGRYVAPACLLPKLRAEPPQSRGEFVGVIRRRVIEQLKKFVDCGADISGIGRLRILAVGDEQRIERHGGL